MKAKFLFIIKILIYRYFQKKKRMFFGEREYFFGGSKDHILTMIVGLRV